MGLTRIGIESALAQIIIIAVIAIVSMAALGALIGKFLVLPLKSAPALNTLLITLMFGTVLRECVRMFYPNGSNPKQEYTRVLLNASLYSRPSEQATA